MTRILHLFFVLVLVVGVSVAPGRADDLTQIIQRHYAGTNSFAAEFKQTLTHKESGSVEKRSGTLLFAKPLRINWQTKAPRAERLVITRQSIWNYIPDEAIAYRYHPNLLNGASTILQVITGQADLMRDFDVKRVGLEQDLQHMTLYPKNPTTQLVEADIWVDPLSGTIRKCKSLDFYGNTNTIELFSYRENVQVRDASFAFTPPKGVEVEDRRNDAQKDLLR